MAESAKRINSSINRIVAKPWARVALSLAVAAIPFIFVFLTYPVAFRGNDDYSIAATLQGNFTGAPQAHHRYTSIFWTWPVSRLYLLFPSVPWHAVCLHIVVWISSAAVLYALLTVSSRNDGFIGAPLAVFVALTLIMSSVAIAQLDFTRSASYACVAGIALGATADFKRMKSAAWTVGAGAALVLAGAAIRYHAALPLSAVFFAVVLCRAAFSFFVEEKRLRKTALSAVAIALCAVIAVFAANAASDAVKRSKDGAENLALVAAVSKYDDYPHESYDEAKELYDSIGWSESYTELVRKWCFLDGGVNADTMASIEQAGIFRAGTMTLRGAASDILSYYRAARSPFTTGFTSWYILVAAAVFSLWAIAAAVYKCAVCKVKFRRIASDLAVLAGTWIACGAMILYLFYGTRYTEHALFGITSPALVVGAVVCLKISFEKGEVRGAAPLRAVLTVAAVLTLAAVLRYPAYRAARVVYNRGMMNWIEWEAKTHETMAAYANANPDNLYISDNGLYGYMMSAYGDTRIDNCNLTIWGDSTYSTVASKAVFERRGKAYLSSETFFDDDVFIMARDECDEVLIEYMREKYGDGVEARLTYADPEYRFKVYHFEMAE